MPRATHPPLHPIPLFMSEIEAMGGAERSILALGRWLSGHAKPVYLLTYYDRIGLERHADFPLPTVVLNPANNARAKVAALRQHFAGRQGHPPPITSGYQPALHCALARIGRFHCLMHDTPSLFSDEHPSLQQRLRFAVSNWQIGRGMRRFGGIMIVTSEFLQEECQRNFGVHAPIARMGGLAHQHAFRRRPVITSSEFANAQRQHEAPTRSANAQRPHEAPTHSANAQRPHEVPTQSANAQRPHEAPTQSANAQRQHEAPTQSANAQRPHEVPTRSANTQRLNLLSVSRIEANKRIDWILDALAALEQAPAPLSSRVDWRFDLAGKGSQLEAMTARARDLGLANRVHFQGFVSDADLEVLYDHAHLFLMPAVQGYGIPAIEALGRGIPVLLHRDSGVSDLLLDTPWATVLTGGIDELTPKLATLIDWLLSNGQLSASPPPVLPTEDTWAERVATLCGYL